MTILKATPFSCTWWFCPDVTFITGIRVRLGVFLYAFLLTLSLKDCVQLCWVASFLVPFSLQNIIIRPIQSTSCCLSQKFFVCICYKWYKNTMEWEVGLGERNVKHRKNTERLDLSWEK